MKKGVQHIIQEIQHFEYKTANSVCRHVVKCGLYSSGKIQVCGWKPAGGLPYNGVLLNNLNTIELAIGLWLIMKTNNM